MRKLTQLDDPSYFSELSDEGDNADPIEFDAGKLLFGNSFVSLMAMEGADILGGQKNIFGLKKKKGSGIMKCRDYLHYLLY